MTLLKLQLELPPVQDLNPDLFLNLVHYSDRIVSVQVTTVKSVLFVLAPGSLVYKKIWVCSFYGKCSQIGVWRESVLSMCNSDPHKHVLFIVYNSKASASLAK